MKLWVLLSLVLAFSCYAAPAEKPTPTPTPVPYATRGISKSTVLVYLESPNGSKIFDCTATRVKMPDESILSQPRYLTAAHCVSESEAKTGKLRRTRQPIYLSEDDGTESSSYHLARIVNMGDEDEGMDYAILSSHLSVPALELGDERILEAGSHVIVYGGVAGLGVSQVNGRIARLAISRGLVNTDEHLVWTGNMALDMPITGGASGSAVLSDGKVVGIVLGYVKTIGVALPISRVKEDLSRADQKNAPHDH